MRIDASGNVAVNGVITANGGSSVIGGGGSGGSIFITCAGAFSGGASGALQANGGNSVGYGAGAGGRMAVICTAMVPTNVKVRFSTKQGTGGTGIAEMGTLYLSNTNLLSGTLGDQFDYVRLIIPTFSAWNVADLTVSNSVVSLGENGLTLTVANNLTIGTGGVLILGGDGLVSGWSHEAIAGSTSLTVTVGGSAMLTNGGCLVVYGRATNAADSYGTVVSVSGALTIGSGSWIAPYSHPTNGGAVLFRVGSLVIAGPNGGFNADSKGYAGQNISAAGAPGYGPGKGAYTTGGGYGGKGGDSTYGSGGVTYGSTNAPIDPGSGGGGWLNYQGGAGGGAVRVEASRDVTVNGVITANGGASSVGGGGSGGGIFMTCGRVFSGSTNGVLRANGGNCTAYGAGGGGRIAVWTVPTSRLARILGGNLGGVSVTNDPSATRYQGSVSVTNGIGIGSGDPGTIAFLNSTIGGGTVIVVY